MPATLIVGLGNPGKKYEKTRHNAGFAVVDAVAVAGQTANSGFDRWQEKFEALAATGRIGGEKVILLKPKTYMNESGRSVRQAADFFKIPSEKIIVIHDDKDLPLGSLRLRPDGSAGGHNGVKSVIAHLGTENFPRVRLGIGPDGPTGDAADFVLDTFRPEERPIMKQAVTTAAAAAIAIVQDGLTAAMNKFNG